jgi:hypothetical protein
LQQRHGTEDALRALIAADPYQGEPREHPRLFNFVRPGARRTEMFRGVIGADPQSKPLIGLLTDTINDPVRPPAGREPGRGGHPPTRCAPP